MITNTEISRRNQNFVATIIKEGKEVVITDVKMNKQLHKLKITKKSEVASHFTSISFSYKDTYLAAATSSGDVQVINIKNGNVELFQKHHFGEIKCIVFSKIQDLLYSTAEDGIIKTYDFTLQKQNKVLSIKNYAKKETAKGILSTLNKNTEAHYIDVNGKDTLILLAIKSNILLYNLIDNQFV